MRNEIRYVEHPGFIIKESIGELGLSQQEFALRTGLTTKNVSTLLNGESPITFEIAVKLGNFFDINPQSWLNLQNHYDLYINQEKRKEELNQEWNIAKLFTNSKAKQCLNIDISSKDKKDAILKLRSLFKVANLNLLKQSNMYVFCKTAVNKDISEKTIIMRNAWISLAEQKARDIKVDKFDKKILLESIDTIRSFTKEDPFVFLPKLKEILAKGGIKLVILPYLPNSNVSGITKWIPQEECSLIAINDCGKVADKIWFSIFHELGHAIKNHRRHMTISYQNNGVIDKDEIEANEFAQNSLINQSNYNKFINEEDFSLESINQFAKNENIANFIVIGRLQTDGFLTWSDYADLKVQYEILY